MNEDLLRPYKKIKAAEDLVKSNHLLDLYADCYRRKFHGPPVYPPGNAHLNIIKDIQEACGDRAMEIIQHYFEMPDQDGWFLKRGYTLHELLKSLSRVNASLSSRQGHQKFSGMVYTHMYCGACGMRHMYHFDKSFNYDKPFRCEKCVQLNESFQFPTREERIRANIGFGEVFLSLLPGTTSPTKES